MVWLIVAAIAVKIIGLSVLGYLIFADPLDRLSRPADHRDER